MVAETPTPGLDTVSLAEIVGGRERGEASEAPLDRPLTVVHTSGSTGAPKAVLHTVGNHVWSARGVVEALGVTERSRWLLDLPLYHVGGLGVVVRCALAGATLAVPPRAMPLADRISVLRPTHASLVATQLARLLDAGADLSVLDAVLLGGSAVPADLLDRATEAGVPVVVSYGMTEMTATITATAPGGSRDALATSGRPLRYRRVRISDAGEIEVGGPTLAGVLGPDGVQPPPEWHATGDLGRLDADGRLVVTGRRDLQFVSGGENVHPEPIEAALLAARRRRRGGRGARPGRGVRRPPRRVRPHRERGAARRVGAGGRRPPVAAGLHGAGRVPRLVRRGRPETGPPGAHARSGAPGGRRVSRRAGARVR